MIRKYKIMLVISSINGGGAELVVSNLCKFLDREKFRVSCCHLKERGSRGEDLYKAGYDIVGLPNSIYKKADYFSFLKFRKIIRERKIDLIHSHSTHSLIDASLCKLIIPNVKLIHTFHFGNYPHKKKHQFILENVFCRIPNLLIAVGYSQREKIRKTYHVGNHRLITIYNGVEKALPAKNSIWIKKYRFEPRIIIGTMCTFIEQKGLFDLLVVASKLKERGNKILFVVVGDGPLGPKLEKRRNELNLKKEVQFLKWINDAATNILPVFDIFFQSSKWEAMSMVVLEAMFAGKPVVATDVGENRTILTKAKGGIIVPTQDINGMVNSLEYLMKNKEVRLQMGENNRKAAEIYYSAQQMARFYEEVYLRILNV